MKKPDISGPSDAGDAEIQALRRRVNPLTALGSYQFVDIDVTGARTVYSGYLTAAPNGVPEPASAALLLTGLALAGLARKRKP